MAKSRSFFGLRRGSTKSFTFSILGGQQITKDRVQEVKNPRTYAQQFQRAKFASMVKFFKQLPSGLLTYAYEDKKQTESYYNAFMRHNNNRICTYLAEQNKDNNFLVCGDALITKGSLGVLEVKRAYYQDGRWVFNVGGLSTFGIEPSVTTVAGVSEVLVNNGYQIGDIVTIIASKTDMAVIDNPPYFEGNAMPQRCLMQFEIDTTNDQLISKTVRSGTALVTLDYDGDLQMCMSAEAEETVMFMCSIVISRKTASGVKVTTSNMTVPEDYPLDVLLIDSYSAPSRPGVAANTWSKLVAQSYDGEEGDAILQGGLIEEDAELKIVARPDVPATWTTLSGKSITFNKPLDTPRAFQQVYGVQLDFNLSTGKKHFITGATWDNAQVFDEASGTVCALTISADKKTITFGSIEALGTTQVVSIALTPVQD